MNQEPSSGSQPLDPESFVDYIKAIHHENRTTGRGTFTENDYQVSARIPPKLYKAFFAYLKEKGWSKSRGVQFAIHQLLTGDIK